MENEALSHPSVGTKRPVSAISQQAPPAEISTTQSSGSSPPIPSATSGASVAGPPSAGPVANGVGAAAAEGEQPKSRNHGKAAYGPDMEIIEVTNDGIPENMEMLIHLKVCTGGCVSIYTKISLYLLYQQSMGLSIGAQARCVGGLLLLQGCVSEPSLSLRSNRCTINLKS